MEKIKSILQSDLFIKNVTSLLFGMMGAMIIFIITHMLHQPERKIATVNITYLIDQFIKDEQQKNVPQAILEKDTKLFGQRLEATLKRLADENHLILLPKEAVIAGSRDYTDQLRAILKEGKDA